MIPNRPYSCSGEKAPCWDFYGRVTPVSTSYEQYCLKYMPKEEMIYHVKVQQLLSADGRRLIFFFFCNKKGLIKSLSMSGHGFEMCHQKSLSMSYKLSMGFVKKPYRLNCNIVRLIQTH